MKTDDWRLHYTYLAIIGSIAAGFALLFLSLPRIPPEAIVAVAVAIFNLALGFVVGRETGAGASRAAERAVNQGANSGVATPDEGKK